MLKKNKNKKRKPNDKYTRHAVKLAFGEKQKNKS